ncbi:MAG: tetratricopeptide repeat protein, partial [Flavobacteriales bacterium]|nr:tetratricopeptide repeat protein [Flavobacteriales bacterium]
MVRLKLIIFSFLVSSVAYPFNYDSLWVHNNNSAVDSELISTQIKLTYDILDYVSASQALPYARRICSIAKKRNSNREIVNANTLLGIVFLELNRTDTAYAIFKANYDLSKKINYVNGVNKSCGNLASTLMEIEDHRNAIIYIIESLEIYKDLNDSLGVAKRWLQMARLYSVQGQKMEADSLARLALNFSKRLRSNRLIANCFNALYLINDDKSRLDSTLFYFEQAIYYHQSYGDSFSVIRDKINMSDFFYKQGRFKEAEDILDRIFKQPNQVNQLDYATTQLMLSRIKLANGKYDTAGDILGRLDTTLLN